MLFIRLTNTGCVVLMHQGPVDRVLAISSCECYLPLYSVKFKLLYLPSCAKGNYRY